MCDGFVVEIPVIQKDLGSLVVSLDRHIDFGIIARSDYLGLA